MARLTSLYWVTFVKTVVWHCYRESMDRITLQRFSSSWWDVKWWCQTTCSYAIGAGSWYVTTPSFLIAWWVPRLMDCHSPRSTTVLVHVLVTQCVCCSLPVAACYVPSSPSRRVTHAQAFHSVSWAPPTLRLTRVLCAQTTLGAHTCVAAAATVTK